MYLPHILVGAALFAESCLAADALSSVTAENIIKVAPLSKSCEAGAKECTDAQHAAPLLASSFKNFGTTSTVEVALLISNMAFESGDFKSYHHHFPSDEPGQGTYNMQSAKFNLQFAQALPSLKDQLNKITGGKNSDAAALSDKQRIQLVDMLHTNGASFEGASWYLVTQCADVKQMISGGKAAKDVFEAHAKCLGITTIEEKRRTTFEKAVEVFKA